MISVTQLIIRTVLTLCVIWSRAIELLFNKLRKGHFRLLLH